jgi:hypothetical protein
MLVGAALVALVPLLRGGLLSSLESAFGMRSGPVISGVLLFAAPSLVLAMLTPFAVKWSAQIQGQEELLGQLTGRLFAWSTVGSIAGTFLTGFVLVPWFGLNATFTMTGALLALIATVGLYLTAKATDRPSPPRPNSASMTGIFFAGCLLAGLAGSIWKPGPKLSEETLWYQENMYHAVRVVENEQEEGTLLELYLDFQSEGAMLLGDAHGLYYDYTRFAADHENRAASHDGHRQVVVDGERPDPGSSPCAENRADIVPACGACPRLARCKTHRP